MQCAGIILPQEFTIDTHWQTMESQFRLTPIFIEPYLPWPPFLMTTMSSSTVVLMN